MKRRTFLGSTALVSLGATLARYLPAAATPSELPMVEAPTAQEKPPRELPQEPQLKPIPKPAHLATWPVEVTGLMNIRQMYLDGKEPRHNAAHLEAFVDVIINGALVIKGYKLIRNKSGNLFVNPPAQPVTHNGWVPMISIDRDENGARIQKEIIERYENWVNWKERTTRTTRTTRTLQDNSGDDKYANKT
jgi:DNA-binding cell septation regulator SpoVG